MTQKEAQVHRAEKSVLPNLIPAEFAEMGKKRLEDFVNMQTELLNTLQETNRHWFDRAQAEANLASEFTTKLTAARSLPEVMEVYQELASRRFEMMAEDGKHFLADTQKLMQAGARSLSYGSSINGSGGLSTQIEETSAANATGRSTSLASRQLREF